MGMANAAIESASAGEGPISMPSASMFSSRAGPNSSGSVGPAGGDAARRGHRRLGLDVEDQLVEVGPLLDAGGLDLVADLHHRRVDRVDRDAADLGAGGLVLGGRDVSTTALDDELDLQ